MGKRTDLNKTEYRVPVGEENFYHAMITKGTQNFDPVTGERVNFSYLQKFSKPEWAVFSTHAHLAGYSFDILHEPK